VVTVCVVAVLVVVEGVVVDDADGFQIVNLHVLLSLKEKKFIDIIYFLFSIYLTPETSSFKSAVLISSSYTL